MCINVNVFGIFMIKERSNNPFKIIYYHEILNIYAEDQNCYINYVSKEEN